MALIITSCSKINCDAQSIKFTETTGEYSPSNVGGWNAPNTNIATITSAVINVQVPDSTTLQPGATVIPINVAGFMPSDNPSSFYNILNSSLGYTNGKLPDGAYIINPVYSDGTSTFKEDVSGTNWKLFYQNAACDLQKLNSMIKWNNSGCCDNKLLDIFLDVNSRLLAMCASWCCKNPLEALQRLMEAKKILAKALNC
jgi:hypothetical protein